ncbi:MAG: cyclic nucleotide-binding domain-containing protein [Gammaproteobacteria bacterium]|nr:cyclic nucleotide-binding domain-containing protein [Gammaproteobacteria bacterium]
MACIEPLISHPDFTEGEYWQRIIVERDTKIIEQGQAGQHFYFLEQGQLRVLGRVELEQDKNVNPGVYDVEPGQIVGELILFDDQPRSATVKAVERSVLLQFDGVKTMQFLEHHPEVGFGFMRELMKVMVGRLRSTNQKVFSLLAWGLKVHGIGKEL